jgi:hypothetical protein
MYFHIRRLVITIAVFLFACNGNEGNTASTHGDSSVDAYTADSSVNSNADSSAAGSAAIDGSYVVSDASLADVTQQPDADQPDVQAIDWSLGGLNQDLPEPSENCMDGRTPLIGCISATGVLNGEAFEFVCPPDYDMAFTSGGGTAGLFCSNGLRVTLKKWDSAPTSFEYTVVPGYTELPADIRYTIEDVGMVAADSDNFEELRIAGVTKKMGPDFRKEAHEVKGTFAASWSKPDSNDANCESCVELRIRGTYLGYWDD